MQVDELDRAGIVEVAAGGWHSAALTAGGVCYIWVRTRLTHTAWQLVAAQACMVAEGRSFLLLKGRGEYGRLGLGENWKDRLRPTELPLTDRIRDVRVPPIHPAGRPLHAACDAASGL